MSKNHLKLRMRRFRQNNMLLLHLPGCKASSRIFRYIGLSACNRIRHRRIHHCIRTIRELSRWRLDHKGYHRRQRYREFLSSQNRMSMNRSHRSGRCHEYRIQNRHTDIRSRNAVNHIHYIKSPPSLLRSRTYWEQNSRRVRTQANIPEFHTKARSSHHCRYMLKARCKHREHKA